jgi:hypothetical protein
MWTRELASLVFSMGRIRFGLHSIIKITACMLEQKQWLRLNLKVDLSLKAFNKKEKIKKRF